MRARHDLPDIDDVKVALQGDILRLCAELLPGGRSDGSHWLAGSVLGEPGQSLRVMLTRGDEGRWKDFSSGEAGHVMQLIRACRYPDDRDYKRAYHWALHWLGLSDLSVEEVARLKEEAERRRAANAKAAEDRRDRYQAAARRVFFGAVERIEGTPAEAYLRGRGVDPAWWGGGWPRSLRFAPELLHGKSGLIAPALVAAIVDQAGRTVAVHRTWLEEDGAGGWRKVLHLGREAKMSLASYKDVGGFIRLRRGATGKRWKDMAEGETVYVTEGIEDALSLAMAMPDARIACAVSVSSLCNSRFPAGTRLVVYADNDGAGTSAEAGLHRAVAAHRARGLEVRIARPPAGYKDVNDWLRGVQADA